MINSARRQGIDIFAPFWTRWEKGFPDLLKTRSGSQFPECLYEQGPRVIEVLSMGSRLLGLRQYLR